MSIIKMCHTLHKHITYTLNAHLKENRQIIVTFDASSVFPSIRHFQVSEILQKVKFTEISQNIGYFPIPKSGTPVFTEIINSTKS